jgi:cytochrome c oxidase cbb3-type subunit III
MKLSKREWGLPGAIIATISVVMLMMSTGDRVETSSEDGKVIYRTYCANCHGINGRGNGISADFVGDIKRMAKSDEELLLSIREGMIGKIGSMPAWGSALTEKQTEEVLKYIRSTFQLGETE